MSNSTSINSVAKSDGSYVIPGISKVHHKYTAKKWDKWWFRVNKKEKYQESLMNKWVNESVYVFVNQIVTCEVGTTWSSWRRWNTPTFATHLLQL